MIISAVVITKNSGKTLKKCLESLFQVADEMIIVDSGSTDDTLRIAETYSCKVLNTTWLGYGLTKNIGHEAALGTYVLSLDSDEELSSSLVAEILSVKNNLQGIYGFRRLNNYCGRWIRYGSWYPDKKLRLFPKEIRWNTALSHEQLLLPDKKGIKWLNHPMLHYAYSSKAELKSKTYLYASLGASEKRGTNKLALLFKFIFSPLSTFIKSYLLKGGFLDGRFGFEISYHIALGNFLRYRALFKTEILGVKINNT